MYQTVFHCEQRRRTTEENRCSPIGSIGSPTSISIGNVEITKGITINGKYITLTGGNIIGNINDAWISLEGGGLNIDQIKITNKESYGGLPIYVDGGRLIINNSLIDGGEGGGISGVSNLDL